MMKNHKILKIILIFSLYFLSYVAAVCYHLEFLCDILSPFSSFFAFSAIFITYLTVDSKKTIKSSWLYLGFACLIWTAADILWAVNTILFHHNMLRSTWIELIYLSSSVFLFFSIIIYSIFEFKKWNAIQLIADSVTNTILFLLFIWITFFNKNIPSAALLSKNSSIYAISLIVDMVSILGMSIWYFSIRCGKVPAYLRINFYSLTLFYLTDLGWVYLHINDLYFPNSVVDALYVLSFLGLATGALFKIYTNQPSDSNEFQFFNVGVRKRGLFLLVFPILTVLFKGFVLTDLLNFIFIIFLHEALTVYIQSSIKNQLLLKKEQELNLELENNIAKRTLELVKKNEQLNFISNMDTVTKLYNRRFFIRMLDEKFNHIQETETLALLFIDMDRFKTINDTYGHDIGDQVLVEISRRLQNMNFEDAVLARLGGDEFVLAFHSGYLYGDVEKIAQEIIEKCSHVIEIKNYSFHLTFSIGISIFPLDAKNVDMLLQNADMAMYQAKKQGFNQFVSFNHQLNDIIQRKNQIEILLKRIHYDQEFTLYYQPQFSIPDKCLIGAEALIRWKNPEKGFIPPGEFIPIAEETDDIIPIGKWVIQNAIRQIGVWNHSYGCNIKMSINVSPKQLNQHSFIEKLESCLKTNSVNAKWVDLEITEGVAMDSKYPLAAVSGKLREIGVSISIDDFGTGYSSLSKLKSFPFDRIKIAKPMIDAITTDHYDLQITKFTITLAKSIGIETIAEGVEFQKQFDVLSELGCEQIQGYFLGKPEPPQQFEEHFLKNKSILHQTGI